MKMGLGHFGGAGWSPGAAEKWAHKTVPVKVIFASVQLTRASTCGTEGHTFYFLSLLCLGNYFNVA